MAPGLTQNGVSPQEIIFGNNLIPMATSIDDVASEKENHASVGMECNIKNLYQERDEHGAYTWTDKYPDNLGEAVENEITAQYAILVRNKKSLDSRKKLEIDSIVIQSPLLKKVLSKVLKDYPGVTPTLKRLTFNAPFAPFIHRWSQFTQAIGEQGNAASREHLLLLHKTLERELRDVIAAKEDYIKNKVITYEHLYTIFEPGATIYTNEWGHHCASKFNNGNYIGHPKDGPCYSVSSQRVNWDGEKFGYAPENHQLPAFVGTMRISDLEAFPLQFHPEEMKIRSLVLKRGKLFEHYHGYHYKAYKAFAIGKDMCGRDIKVTVDSRIIIDTFAYGKFNPNTLRALTPLKTIRKAEVPEDSSSEDEEEDFPDFFTVCHTDEKSGKKSEHIPLTNEQLIHCSPLVRGYALKSKLWLSFFVDSVSEISFNTAAFSSLVLPDDQKELILAFAESQVKYKESFDDVISGKGKGIIMLLSGGPGIGKTLTAESVAENMKVPLYMMSAGDLGVNSAQVESSLTKILEMVAKWNAVLLLDECDVFLEARSAHQLERNKIVSIFLRTLEYYEGILFLTTNRVKNMDPAFQSRIHISMEYPELTKSAREQVWGNFLKGMENELTKGELNSLAEVEINGRQIKNILKSAGLLAKHKGVNLRYEHLRTVLDIEKKVS